MSFILLLIPGIAGLLAGFCLNKIICRVSQTAGAGPGLACGIRPKDEAGSEFTLQTRNRYCMFVQIVAGFIFVAVFISSGVTLYSVSRIFLLSLLLAISVIDLEEHRIPNVLVFTGLMGGILLHLISFSACIGGLSPRLYAGIPLTDALWGAALGGGVMFLIFLAGRGGMGAGDVKLMAVMGLFLGKRGAVAVLFLSFILGATAGILLIVTKKCGRKEPLAFAPFLWLAAVMEGFWGDKLWDWYLNIS